MMKRDILPWGRIKRKRWNGEEGNVDNETREEVNVDNETSTYQVQKGFNSKSIITSGNKSHREEFLRYHYETIVGKFLEVHKIQL